ncbi:phosphotransferase family protein [Nonomuraea mangrovi]|uniref:Phosphotransferase family protein n=1 Tax=Nonomuraea mangrovi TaxID=2316207 RepID=A0ABW4SKP0_9ACTN
MQVPPVLPGGRRRALAAARGWSRPRCHNDLSPGNTIYSGGRAIAFVDWDLAAPGRRIHDVAHPCWQFTRLREVEPTLAGMRAVCEGYDLTDRSELIAAVLWWQERCRTGIERAARAGDPAMLRLQGRRVVDEIHAAEQWVRAHRKTLEEGLRQ